MSKTDSYFNPEQYATVAYCSGLKKESVFGIGHSTTLIGFPTYARRKAETRANYVNFVRLAPCPSSSRYVFGRISAWVEARGPHGATFAWSEPLTALPRSARSRVSSSRSL